MPGPPQRLLLVLRDQAFRGRGHGGGRSVGADLANPDQPAGGRTSRPPALLRDDVTRCLEPEPDEADVEVERRGLPSHRLVGKDVAVVTTSARTITS